VSKVGAYPSGTSFLFKGRIMASPTSIKLDLKSLPGTNTLAYYENS
jgi:hypothetical protein